ncbi:MULTISPECIES: M48 family metalloprotease [unclassified Microcoleus]|uniref:M48 family metalloprotease n=1 Tax=unclassified Microcoleus TaxID=2642155 RepID=UPI001DFFEB55|nr:MULTISPECIES: M48 family metalloprotease [unclassified Microcoleus]TAE44212.1 MAG: M48 family peptidase [Oscillatoriales cyanobacterium]MCC3470533.1 M48 family metalloprotease [Microcoleus sp. PH2017_13_LAR_U_A]MCC3483059.1 M48 family metalloprotease [Microcoleus sp. PH2017_14_LAR_D_A]MCC3495079.1 M48 family metalloprotease [Microcoleus sp. PH2017_15_JOR_U_A]MCC3524734.1 M48 family metalloprotease [Microcoleus sp. PH2017_20_SFW_D_A]
MSRFLFRFAIGLLMAFFGAITYFTSSVQNPVTGEKQRVQLSPRQEVVLGLEARDKMAAQYGGLYPGQSIQQYVDRVGERVVNGSEAKKAGYPFEFHLLRDSKTVNAFALPGGQVFITAGLMRLLNSEAQLAAVLGHESGHVVGRHAAEHLAKQQLGRSLVTAVGVATTDDRGGGQQAALIAQAVNQVVGLRYGRADELESDRLGFQFMTEAGYDPRGIVEVMQILGSARNGEAPPEFLSSHPNPENRVEKLQALIAQSFPNGVPANLVSGREEFAKNVSGG